MQRSVRATGSPGRGQPNLEPRASSQLARPVHPAAVVLGDVLDDRQAEPGPARLARAGAIDAVEALEDAWQVAVRDAEAGVRDREDDLAVRAGELDVHLPTRPGVADRVVHEVAHQQRQV